MIKYIVFLSFLLLPVCSGAMMETDTFPKIGLGQPARMWSKRNIAASNMGVWLHAKRKIYFRTIEQGEFQPIGFLGKDIRPYLVHNLESMAEFKIYKDYATRGKIASACVFISIVCTVMSFGIYGANESLGSGEELPLMTSPVFWVPLTALLVAGRNTTCLHAQKHLWKAVQISNGTPDIPLGRSYYRPPSLGLGIGQRGVSIAFTF